MDARKQRLKSFYKIYQPEKVADVDSLLDKVGRSNARFDQLMEMLIEKYGPEPTESNPDLLRKRVLSFYSHYNKSKLSNVDNLVKRTKQNPEYEMRLIQMLIRKYGAEPELIEVDMKKLKLQSDSENSDDEDDDDDSDDDYDFEKRLTRFYEKYAPTKLSDVPRLVEKTQGHYQNEEKLMKMLVEKYGPEPESEEEEEEEEEEEQDTTVVVEQDEEETNNDDDVNAEDNGQDESRLLREIVYCPIDGFPPEFSEYLDTFPQALPWLLANCPDLILTSKKNVTVEAYVSSLADKDSIVTESLKSKRGGAGRPNKQLKGSKKKVETFLHIERVQRQKRKFVTSVVGIDTFGIKLKEAAKQLGKKFACGASINKLPNGNQSIDVQGDYMYELPDVILEFYPQVDKSKMMFIESGKKTPAFS